MSRPDLNAALFYTPAEVAEIFRKPGVRWAYRAASYGFLKPYARRFGKTLLFSREGIDRLVRENGD